MVLWFGPPEHCFYEGYVIVTGQELVSSLPSDNDVLLQTSKEGKQYPVDRWKGTNSWVWLVINAQEWLMQN